MVNKLYLWCKSSEFMIDGQVLKCALMATHIIYTYFTSTRVHEIACLYIRGLKVCACMSFRAIASPVCTFKTIKL